MARLPQSCCCCCSLKTGATILGSLDIIGSPLLISFLLLSYDSIIQQQAQHLGYEAARVAVTASIVYYVVVLIIGILLVVGAVKNKPALLIPYMINCIIGMILIVVWDVVLIVLINDTGARIIVACTLIACIPLPIYFCLVVVSLYKKQKAENESSKGHIYQANV